ncbi:flagellar hook-basal body complex protein FliE [Vagococcus fluvialis]|jgi:flagellar hook-basal body complex protein FliE|uniref:flagellar hook-basal body complex protein FliE n=1 Tax=Vagococcus fluvialis TaxID=2738 RepID=UPI001A8EDFFB|nr:flagellar hook-basal body complex protein FliE [Vagococcus fluvialis]MBO0429029.1 flagellar hook-basal body complex protein FliE [Vagococcus fluvialis]
MTISNHLNSIQTYQNELKEIMNSNSISEKSNEKNNPNFSNILSQTIDKVDTEISKSSENIPKLLSGELDNMHTAMIDMSSSQLVLQSAVQVRNKCIEAYNDIKNMQF